MRRREREHEADDRDRRATGPSPLQSFPANAKSAQRVVLEAEPARRGRAAATRDASRHAWPRVDEHERARRRGTRAAASADGDREPPPPAPAGDDERHERGRRAGYFALAASPAATPAHSSRPVTSSASATVDAARQRHVGDRHVRVGDVRRLDRDDRGRDRRRPTTPYAARPSHHAAATAAERRSATITTARRGTTASSCHAWNGAST